MTQYPESGIKLVADTSDYTSAMEEAIALADQFDALGDLTMTVSAELDTSGVSLDDLPLDGETVNFTVEADVQGDLADLPKDGETVSTTVDVAPTDTAAKTLSAVETIKNLKILETVWNVTGTAVDVFKSVGEWAVKPMLSLDDAVARVNATTGSSIPNARELISNIFYDDLGDSIDQVADMVTKAGQLKLPIDEAVRSALTFTHTFKDQNPQQVLDTMNEMVKAKLAPNFTVAGDMLVRAFQNGANKGGDLLQTLSDNATAIHDLGLSGPEALSFIKTGMDNGFKSADQVLQVLLKIKQNVSNAAGDAGSDVSKTLKQLGIANPAETGEAWSAEFFQSVIDKITSMPGLSDTEREQLFSNLAGGKQGGRVFSSFLQLSPEDAKGIFENVAGAAAEAATAVDDSLSGAIDDFTLAAQKAAEDFLSSDQIDLPGKINALKTGLQDALNVLSEGGTLGDALTVALKPIGFDDEFQGLESALGNFVIGILQAVAQLQDITGHGAEAAGTRATIAGMAKNQLAFDLKVANPDEIAQTIDTAVSRGVSGQSVADTAKTAVDELIASGASDRAQAIVDSLRTQADTGIQLKLLPGVDESTKGLVKQQLEDFGFGTLNDDGTISMNISPGMSPESISGLAKTIQDTVTGNFDAKVIEGVEIKPTISKDTINELQATIDTSKDATNQAMRDTKDASLTLTTDVNTATNAMQTQAQAALTPVNQMTTNTTNQGTAAGQAAPKVQQNADANKRLGDNAARAGAQVSGAADQMGSIAANAPIAASGLTALDLAIQHIIATANSLAAASDAVAQKQGQLDAKLADTGSSSGSGGNNVPVDFRGDTTLTSALQPYINIGRSTTKSGSSIAITNINHVQSEAQADAVGYSTGRILRGVN